MCIIRSGLPGLLFTILGLGCLNHSNGFGGQGMFFWSETSLLTVSGQIYSDPSEVPRFSYVVHGSGSADGYISGILETVSRYTYIDPIPQIVAEDIVAGSGSPVGNRGFVLTNDTTTVAGDYKTLFAATITAMKGSFNVPANLCRRVYFIGITSANQIDTSLYMKRGVAPSNDYDICYEITDREPLTCTDAARQKLMADMLFSQVGGLDDSGKNGSWTERVQEEFNADYGTPDSVDTSMCGKGK